MFSLFLTRHGQYLIMFKDSSVFEFTNFPFKTKYNDTVVYSVKKQIFHAFLFNIRNYLPKVINIERREEELNIILPRVNSFDIKQKKARNICFIICPQHQTRSGKLKTNKTANFSQIASLFS